MSVVGEIVDELTSQVATVLGGSYSPRAFMYQTELNDRQGAKTYSIRAGAAGASPTTTRAVTWTQTFEIDISHTYENKKGSGESDLQSKIKLAADDIEGLYQELAMKHISIASGKVLLVSPVDISSPEVDNNVVTLTLTLSVQYRVSIN
jgi:hypothetical protein